MTDEVNGSLVRIDPVSGRVTQRTRVGTRVGPVVFGFGAVWTVDYVKNLLKIDPRTGSVIEKIAIGPQPNLAMAAALSGSLMDRMRSRRSIHGG